MTEPALAPVVEGARTNPCSHVNCLSRQHLGADLRLPTGYKVLFWRVPIPLAIFCGILLGLTFARVTRHALAKGSEGPHASPAFALVSAFGLLILAPVAGMSVAMSPDWALCYIVDSQRAPIISETLSVMLATLSVPISFLWGATLAGRRHLGLVTRHIAATACVTLLLCALLWKRMSVQATYTQFHGDFGVQPVAGSNLGYAILWMLILLCLATTWTLVSLTKLGQPTTDD